EPPVSTVPARPNVLDASGPVLPMAVSFADLPAKIPMAPCKEVAIAMVDGTATALGEKLDAGDVMLVRGGDPFEVAGAGVIVEVDQPGSEGCSEKRSMTKQVVRIAATPELTWAKGTMHARLQLGEKQNAAFYLGRLEGSAPVVEHVHKGTWEILASIE